jgi:hypothetical protein
MLSHSQEGLFDEPVSQHTSKPAAWATTERTDYRRDTRLAVPSFPLLFQVILYFQVRLQEKRQNNI